MSKVPEEKSSSFPRERRRSALAEDALINCFHWFCFVASVGHSHKNAAKINKNVHLRSRKPVVCSSSLANRRGNVANARLSYCSCLPGLHTSCCIALLLNRRRSVLGHLSSWSTLLSLFVQQKGAKFTLKCHIHPRVTSHPPKVTSLDHDVLVILCALSFAISHDSVSI